MALFTLDQLISSSRDMCRMREYTHTCTHTHTHTATKMEACFNLAIYLGK